MTVLFKRIKQKIILLDLIEGLIALFEFLGSLLSEPFKDKNEKSDKERKKRKQGY